jgi:sialic acid synthase SpsE
LDFLESGLSLAATGLWPRKDFLEMANLPATTQVKLSSNCREIHTYMEQKLCELDRLQLMGKKNLDLWKIPSSELWQELLLLLLLLLV